MSHSPTAQLGQGSGSGRRTMPTTRSPGSTPLPLGASRTRPRDSWPRMRRSFPGGAQPPPTISTSVPHTPTASVPTSTLPSRRSGSGTCSNLADPGWPGSTVSARIVMNRSPLPVSHSMLRLQAQDPSVVVARRLRRDTPVLERRLQDPAAIELAYRVAVDLLPGRTALRDWGDAFLLAAFDLFVGHEHVAAPLVEINTYGVVGAQPGQAAARGALGRGVEDRGAVRGAGLPAVADGWQRVDAALDERVGGLHVDHFGRAGPADGPRAPQSPGSCARRCQARVR